MCIFANTLFRVLSLQIRFDLHTNVLQIENLCNAYWCVPNRITIYSAERMAVYLCGWSTLIASLVFFFFFFISVLDFVYYCWQFGIWNKKISNLIFSPNVVKILAKTMSILNRIQFLHLPKYKTTDWNSKIFKVYLNFKMWFQKINVLSLYWFKNV